MRYFYMLGVICILLFMPNIGLAKEKQAYLSAEHAIVMESESGRVLFEKDAYTQKPIASITKIMTALLAIEHGNLDDIVTISEQASQIHGSSLYLKEGDKVTLRDLLYGLMLRSGNDASIAIAEEIGGSIEGFVFLMNEKAAKLGMVQTKFKNPHGLDEEGHYSTAYDMALLMKEAMKNEQFQEISETKTYTPKYQSYPYINKNQLLTELYDASTGGKTGFTKRSGRTLVSTARKENMDLIAVTLNAPDDWKDHIAMYEEAYATFSLFTIVKEGYIQSNMAANDRKFYAEDSFIYPLKKDEKELLQMKIVLKKINNDKQAFLQLNLEEESIGLLPLKTIENKESNIWMEIKRDLQGWFK